MKLNNVMRSAVAVLLACASLGHAALQVNNGSGATSILSTSAVLNVAVTHTNGSENPRLYVYWGTYQTNDLNWEHTNDFGTNCVIGSYSTQVFGLTPSTYYYYKARGTTTTENSWSAWYSKFHTIQPSTSYPPASVESVTVDTNNALKHPTAAEFYAENPPPSGTIASFTNDLYMGTNNIEQVRQVTYLAPSYRSSGTGLTPDISGLDFYRYDGLYNSSNAYISIDGSWYMWRAGTSGSSWVISEDLGVYTAPAWGKINGIIGNYIVNLGSTGTVTVGAATNIPEQNISARDFYLLISSNQAVTARAAANLDTNTSQAITLTGHEARLDTNDTWRAAMDVTNKVWSVTGDGATYARNINGDSNAVFAGKIGIALTTPTNALDVDGVGHFSGDVKCDDLQLTESTIGEIIASWLNIHMNTSDGSDNGGMWFYSGGSTGCLRGAGAMIYGNETGGGHGGDFDMFAGNVVGGQIRMGTSNDAIRITVDRNGNVCFHTNIVRDVSKLGISVSSPTNELDVDGTAHFSVGLTNSPIWIAFTPTNYSVGNQSLEKHLSGIDSQLTNIQASATGGVNQITLKGTNNTGNITLTAKYGESDGAGAITLAGYDTKIDNLDTATNNMNTFDATVALTNGVRSFRILTVDGVQTNLGPIELNGTNVGETLTTLLASTGGVASATATNEPLDAGDVLYAGTTNGTGHWGRQAYCPWMGDVPLYAATLNIPKSTRKGRRIWITGRPYSICAYQGALFTTCNTNPTCQISRVWKLDPDTMTTNIAYTAGRLQTLYDLCGAYGYIWACNSSSNLIYKLDPSDMSCVSTTAIPSPRGIVSSHDGALWTSSNGGDKLYRIDAATALVTTNVTVGDQPSVGLSFDGSHVWVPCFNDADVRGVNTTTYAVDYNITVGTQPYATFFDGSFLYVPNYGGATVSKIDIQTHTVVATIALENSSGPHTCVKVGDRIYVTLSNLNRLQPVHVYKELKETVYATDVDPAGTCYDGRDIWVTNYKGTNVMRFSP